MGILGYRLDVVDEIGHNYLTKICDSIRENKKDAMYSNSFMQYMSLVI